MKQFELKAMGNEESMELPSMIKIRQKFNRFRVENIEQTIMRDMEEKLQRQQFKGKKIAITAGSRGIVKIEYVLKTVINQLKAWGAKPFIVPAMGSHGGATADGQREVLASYNITEEHLNVPIVASMEVVKIGELDDGLPVYCDRVAYEADGIVVINKIKPHTDFKGDYESGLLKMMAIGLGKHKGAATLHGRGFDQFPQLIPSVGKVFLDEAPILFGLAIVQNAYDEMMHLETIEPKHIFQRERELLQVAKENIARLLLPEVDVLIVEEIGKNISGSGMDANVTGRPGSGLKEGFEAPPIQKIIVLGVTEASHGNGVGIGMADLTTKGCVAGIDFNAMYTNSITATILNPSKIPMTLNTDQEAIEVALKTCNNVIPRHAKVVRIKNTLELYEIEVSESYQKLFKERKDIEVLSDPYPMTFDQAGRLI